MQYFINELCVLLGFLAICFQNSETAYMALIETYKCRIKAKLYP